MSISIEKLTEDQALRYFKARLAGAKLKRTGKTNEFKSNCPFHEDKNPSFQINLGKKTFCCFSCERKGGLLDFEMELMGVDKATALMRISEVVGERILGFKNVEPDHIYRYTNEDGELLYEVIRFDTPNGGKRIGVRKRNPAGGWTYSLDEGQPTRRVLYRLPEVLTKKHILVTEGEKDCEAVASLFRDDPRFAVTTNSGGAGQWLDAYSIFLAGKEVLLFEDRDEPGRKRTTQVGLSLYPFTRRIKSLVAPEPYHDVGDWIKAGGTKEAILELAQKQKWWVPPDTTQGFFVGADTFIRTQPEDTKWAVESLIERGSNGIIIASPKAGKSWLALDLGLHMALGKPWFGYEIPEPMRVAYVSREDNPSLTGRRMRYLRRMISNESLEDKFFLNTKRQVGRLALDDPNDLEQLIHNLKIRKIEFVFLDVFRRLHSADENDNTAMQTVLDRVQAISEQSGASVCLIHHTSKADDPNGAIIQGARGASAIAGYAEFAGRVDVIDRTRWIRRIRWESKAEEEVPKMYFKIKVNKTEEWAAIQQVEYEDDNGNDEGSFRD